MIPQLQLLPGAISEILACVADSGALTLADRYGLLAATLDDSLNECDRRCIDRLLRSVARGKVSLSDRLSSIG